MALIKDALLIIIFPLKIFGATVIDVHKKMITAVLAIALGIASYSPSLIVLFGPSHALAEEDTASRIQVKISQVGASATKLHESGADVSSIQKAMQQVNELLQSGKHQDAEKILDSLLTELGGPETRPAPAAIANIPEATRRRLVHDLGSSFLVFIGKIQEELRLTKGQKEKLDLYLGKLLPDATQLLQKSKELTPGEREAYRQKTHEEMASVLQGILNEDQRTRLCQLERQREGLFGDEWYWTDLKVTDTQRKQFIPEIRQTQKNIEKRLGDIHNTAEANEIRPKVLQSRKDLEDKLEALLTDAQKKQLKEMLGEPIELGALFDLSSQ